ncbi:multidrug efflux RND transporter permease subunit [Rhabdobacter roseus]|uniref:HAE1 family hydrophobic/amphiphilic exporter-1 n=1 Tax=Rhabdobacter roseus TaxID=1655419 RepID=A0A840U522_9BACT|nr:multidrug efflux RND transporter permease subunit [Rhabdobacter roseus]MBB5286909.1 HAE1 family hydrophobic/amphiphilic exporter-1 [Rhabdobacter roseus]
MFANRFIERPILAIVISLVLLLVGTLAILNLPISQYPDISPPTVQISGSFTGADASTVEQTVTTPIETQVNGTPGMTYMSSTSTSDGRTGINVVFDVGTNVDIAALDVQNRVSVAAPQLPSEVTRLGLTVRKRSPSILMLVALYSPEGTHDVNFLNNYANIYVRDALLRVKGVGDIFSRADDFSMRVWLQPDKMAQLGLSSAEVVTALQEQNLQVAVGAIGAPPQQSTQAFEYTVFTNSRLTTVDEFNDVIVRTRPEDGSIVYLKDVARVELGKFSYIGNSFVDGKRAAYLLVYEAPGSNSLETAEGVYAAMRKISQTFPNDLGYLVPFESVSIVQVSIDEVVKTLAEALLLVIVVVFVFLQSWRATLIPLLAIPVSIIGTFIFFIPMGFTINTLTMFGFVLSIGIVVDDAIVVVEAAQHYIDEKGLSAKKATRRAMKDISGPVIAMALILAAVFVPVAFVPGIVGRLYQQFAITIAISVLISALVALTLTPALCAMLLRPMKLDKDSKGLNKVFYRFNTWFGRVTSRYSVGVQKAIRSTPLVLILLICTYVGTGFLFGNKPTGFIPVEDGGRLFVTYELPEAASTTRSIETLERVMKILSETPGIGHYAGLGGLNVVTFASKSNSGTVFCQLEHWKDRKADSLSLDNIAASLRRKLADIKEAKVVVITPPSIPGLGRTGGFSFVLEQRESNDDIRTFERVVTNFVAAANQRPEITGAFSFFTAQTPSYQLTVDRAKAKQLGVSIAEVYSTLQTYLGSRYVNDFTLYGRNFRVVAQADTNYRSDIKELGKYFVRNQSGQMVPISTLVTHEVVESAPLISHYNLFRSTEINGNSPAGYSSGETIQALREVADQVLPVGYGYEFSGLSLEEINAGSSTFYIFGLSVVFVFLFLAALYESWSVPFAVILAVPIGAFGAIVALSFFKDITNNVYAQIGLLTLIGLAAKNAILIVEFAKERVDHGESIWDATLEAVELRLRPILMTSLAFILGVLPLAFSSGAGAAARNTIGWTVFGGMLAATMLAIFIVPVLFALIARLAYGRKSLTERGEVRAPSPAEGSEEHDV